MIEALISSKTRIKLLMKFFLNRRTTSYLRSLESEFGESTNSIRIELNRFEKAGLLKSFVKGNKKIFQANDKHPLFTEIHNILLKHIGVDQIIEQITSRLGNLQSAFLTGSFSAGINSPIIDLVLVGGIDKSFLVILIEKVETIIDRKIRYVIYDQEESIDWSFYTCEPVLIWTKNGKN